MTIAPLDAAARPTADRDAPVVPVVGRNVLLAIVTLAALVCCVLGLLAAGGRPVAAPPGLPDAGVATGWALRTARLLANLTAVVAVGALLVPAYLIPSSRRDGLDPTSRGALAAAARWATTWFGLTALVLVLTAADSGGVPLGRLRPHALLATAATDQGVGLALTMLGAAALVAATARVRSVGGTRVALVLALATLLPVTLTGHATAGADPDVAAAGLAVHVVTAAVWTGGLVALWMHLRHVPGLLARAVPRFSTLALATYVALAGSGVLAATGHLGGSRSGWSSGYGGVVATKAALLVVLGVVGHVHRRRTLPRLTADSSKPFLRLASVELVLMGCAVGLAAALARTPAPAIEVGTSEAHGSGHSTLPGAVERVSPTALLTAWRPNAVVLLLLATALAVYLAGRRTLAAHGHAWPRRRTAAFVTALVVLLLDLSSGVATYAPALVSVQIGQLLVALLPVPLLLALGAPATLALEVRAARALAPPAYLASWQARTLLTPGLGAAAVCTLLLGVYRTPLIDLSLRSSWLHVAVLLLAVAAGVLLWWPVLGLDPVPSPRTTAERAWCLVAVAGCLAILAAQLRYGDRLLAAPWFLELRWGWVDPVADQRLGGAFAGAAAFVTLVAAGVLLARTRDLRVSARRSPRE